MTYLVKYPGHRRKTFSILSRERGRYAKVESPEVDEANRRYLAGEDYEICKRLVVEVKDRLLAAKRKAPLTINDNHRVVALYFKNRSTNHLTDPYAAKQELLRAAEACGPMLIEHTPHLELQAYIDAHYQGRKHKRICAGINRLLRSLGKPYRLQGRVVHHKEPAYIALGSFMEIVKDAKPNVYLTFMGVLFATGARVSEALAIRSLKKDEVWIAQQLNYDPEGALVYRHTKTKGARNSVIVPELRHYVEEWVKVPEAERRALKTVKWNLVARRWFGIRAHDLRHSYAKRLSEMDCTIKEIGENLGISEHVARIHYAGWVQSDHRISIVAKKLRGG